MEKGNDEKKKKTRVLIEIVENFMENGLDVLLEEKKYVRMNKWCASKLPDRAVKRADISVYSWSHYAPVKWIEHQQKTCTVTKAAADKEGPVKAKMNKRRGKKS